MFNTFWQVWPGKKADKKRAKRLFDKLKPEQQQKAINVCQKQYRGVDKQYIPHPSTYLHNERFDDEISEKPKDKGIFTAAHRPYEPK